VIAVHGIWSRDSQLCIWGEDSALPVVGPKRRGRPPVRPRPRQHPFACRARDLRASLRGLGLPHEFAERDLCLLLPSTHSGPQHSPALLRAEADDAAAGCADLLHPWVVPAASFAPADAVDVLLAMPRAGEPGVAFGDSVRFLAETAKLALEFLARGRILPALARHQDQWLARWQPITTDPGDSERVRLLSARCPRCCAARPESPRAEGRPRRS
jgi:hypothetical protein